MHSANSQVNHTPSTVGQLDLIVGGVANIHGAIFRMEVGQPDASFPKPHDDNIVTTN